MATATRLQQKLETWKQEHDDAMEYWNVESEVCQHLTDFEEVRAIDDGWSQAVQAGEEKFDEPLVRLLFDFYIDWQQAANALNERIESVQKKGRNVIRAPEFKAACEQVLAILSVSVDDLILSIQQAERGATKPLQQVMDEHLCEDHG